MSTLAETQAILWPYVEQHPDLVLVGRAVILRPMRHLMCGYFLDRTSSPETLCPFWFANVLYARIPSTGFLWAGRENPQSLDVRSEGFSETLFAHMDRAFAVLRRSSQSLDGFDIGLPMDRDLTHHSNVQGLTRAAKGDLEGAEPFLLSDLNYRKNDLIDNMAFIKQYRRQGSKPWQRDMAGHAIRVKIHANSQALVDLVVARDHAGVAALLHGWERLYIQAWKAEKHWIPSPFPFEAARSG